MDELTSTVYQWLDEIFHGVKICGQFVMVPLAPDPPFLARLHDAPLPTGRQFEVRVPILTQVLDRSGALAAAEQVQDQIYDGHLRCIEVAGETQVEVRYRIEAAAYDQHRLSQLGLRMSMAAKRIGPLLQDIVQGQLVRSVSNDSTAESLGISLPD